MFTLAIPTETTTKITRARARYLPASANSRCSTSARHSQTSAWIRSATELNRTKDALATRFAVVVVASPGAYTRKRITWANPPKTAITRYSRPARLARRTPADPRAGAWTGLGMLLLARPELLVVVTFELVLRSAVGLLFGSAVGVP